MGGSTYCDAGGAVPGVDMVSPPSNSGSRYPVRPQGIQLMASQSGAGHDSEKEMAVNIQEISRPQRHLERKPTIAVVSPFLSMSHGTERIVIEWMNQIAAEFEIH